MMDADGPVQAKKPKMDKDHVSCVYDVLKGIINKRRSCINVVRMS